MPNQYLLGQIAAGGPNPMEMLRQSRRDNELIRGAGLENRVRELQIGDLEYKASPEYRKQQSELASLEYKTKYNDALSKLKDSQLKEVQRKNDRMGQISSWVLTLPPEMRAKAWDSSMESLKAEDIDASPYIGKYSDGLANMMYASSLSVKDQMEQLNKVEDRKLRGREVAATESRAGIEQKKFDLEQKQYEDTQNLISQIMPTAGAVGQPQAAPAAQGAPWMSMTVPPQAGQQPTQMIPQGAMATPGINPASPIATAGAPQGVTPEQLDAAQLAAAAGKNATLATTLRSIRDTRFPDQTQMTRKADEMIKMGYPVDIARMIATGALQKSADMVGNVQWVDVATGDWVVKIEQGELVRNPKYYDKAAGAEPPAGNAPPGNVVLDYTKGR